MKCNNTKCVEYNHKYPLNCSCHVEDERSVSRCDCFQKNEIIDIKQLTLDQLREQFEIFYINQNGTMKKDLLSRSTKGNYGFHKVQMMWLVYKECARANNIIKE